MTVSNSSHENEKASIHFVIHYSVMVIKASNNKVCVSSLLNIYKMLLHPGTQKHQYM
jgi:hypothetical protein